MKGSTKYSGKLLLAAIVTFYGGVGALCLANISLDPFYYYKLPDLPLSAPAASDDSSEEPLTFSRLSRYQNPALLRHLDYDTIIVGTSRSANFKPSMFQDSDWRVLKSSANGSGSHLHKLTIDYAASIGKTKRVILEIPFLSYNKGVDWSNNNAQAIPEYLYKPNALTPFKHLLTLDYLGLSFIKTPFSDEIRRPLEDLQVWFPVHQFKYGAGHFTANIKKSRIFCQGMSEKKRRLLEENVPLRSRIKESINRNLLDTIDRHSNIEFVTFFPPISIFKDYTNPRHHQDRKSFRAYVVNELSKRPNVALYDFAIDKDLVTDLERFKDINHADMQSQIDIARELQNKHSEFVVTDPNDYSDGDPLTKLAMEFDPTELFVCGGDKGKYRAKALEEEFRRVYADYKRYRTTDPKKARELLAQMREVAEYSGNLKWIVDVARVHLNNDTDDTGPQTALEILNASSFDYMPVSWKLRARALTAMGGDENLIKAQEFLDKANQKGKILR